jgi:cysteine protease ATG4
MSSNDNSANGSKESSNSLMDSTNMDKVLRDAKGLASELHIRFTNWWNAMTPISTSSTSATTPKLPKTELDIKQALRKSMSFATPTQSSKSGSNSSNLGIRLWFLGTPYFIMEKDLEELNPEAFQPFLEDFSSRLWFTYRHHFPPLRPATFTTDSGWGCMLRTGQCLLGQTLVLKHLGRGKPFFLLNIKVILISYSRLEIKGHARPQNS